MREIDLYNSAHLGDNVQMMILFYHIKSYIEEHDIIIRYYCLANYHSQLLEFRCSENIHILEYYAPIGVNTWIGHREYTINWHDYYKEYTEKKEPKPEYICYNDFYVLFHNGLLQTLQIPLPITEIQYQDEDLLARFENLPLAYKNIDILIVNSQPLSGQFDLNDNLWNAYITGLHQRYNVVTTKKVEGVKCTTDDDMTIKTIAAISTHAKVVVAINTGVLHGFFNTYSLQNVKKWFLFDKVVTYRYPRFEHKKEITDISLDEFENLLL